MSDLSQKLQEVREIANGELQRRLGTEVQSHESILIANSKYIGHRFKSKNIQVEWVIKSDMFNVIDTTTKESLESFSFAESSSREQSTRRAA